MWSTDHSADTGLSPETIWNALRDLQTGALAPSSGDRHELLGEFAEGSTISS